MNDLDKIIKAERKQKYKRLRKIRKARDMASKHSKRKLLLSKVFKFIKRGERDRFLRTTDLAKYILDYELSINTSPPKPRLVTKKK